MATFTTTNATGMVIPDGAATEQTVTIFGTLGTVTDVQITLTEITHMFSEDLDFLLLAPDGASNLVFMSDTGGADDLIDVTLHFSDSASSLLPGVQIPAGSYRPSDFGAMETGSDFGVGALGALKHAATNGGETFASAFGGIAANGNWRFFAADDSAPTVGAMDGWTLTVTTSDSRVAAAGTVVADNFLVTSTGAGAGTYALNGASIAFSGVTTLTFAGGGGADIFAGGALAETASGDTGDDELSGNAGADVLNGGPGADLLLGGAGADRLTGGLGADILIGGRDGDTYVLENSFDRIADVSGIDTITSTISRSLAGYADIENLTLVSGKSGFGNAGANTLIGNNAANTLTGAGGSDRLIGGLGLDRLHGGAGADRFVYNSSVDSRGANADVIRDFDDAGNDRIDLSAVTTGTLAWRGTSAFTGAKQVHVRDIAGPDVLVEVNIGGSLAPDMVIRLAGTTVGSMSAGDFVL